MASSGNNTSTTTTTVTGAPTANTTTNITATGASGGQNGWLNIQMGGGYGAPLSVVPEQSVTGKSNDNYDENERLTAANSTLKRNPKMELTKNDLLKLVTYFEGEIQARDITVAALKSEKLKQVVTVGRYRPSVMSDPYTALLRDAIADGPTAKPPPVIEREMIAAADAQLQALERLACQQRAAQTHMYQIFQDSEARNRKVVQELDEERAKRMMYAGMTSGAAGGSGGGGGGGVDEVSLSTFEMERQRLRQELEVERNLRGKLEKEMKRQQVIADEERGRQKQIVLLLLAERKKIILKFIEERKRSEDLAQQCNDEKLKYDCMADGLEEESKKSLQMEAELEKQLNLFDAERKALTATIATRDARIQEMEAEIQKLRTDCDTLRAGKASEVAALAALTGSVAAAAAAGAMTSSVAKVVQPTATVSSVPVCGPTTGIAQSVTPGQVLRQVAMYPSSAASLSKGGSAGLPTATAQSTVSSPSSHPSASVGPPVSRLPTTVAANAAKLNSVAAAAAAGGAPPQTPPKKSTLSSIGGGSASSPGLLAGRGVPPPIPPNKPVIPSKHGSIAASSASAAASTDKKPMLKPAAPPPGSLVHHAASTAANTAVAAAVAAAASATGGGTVSGTTTVGNPVATANAATAAHASMSGTTGTIQRSPHTAATHRSVYQPHQPHALTSPQYAHAPLPASHYAAAARSQQQPPTAQQQQQPPASDLSDYQMFLAMTTKQ